MNCEFVFFWMIFFFLINLIEEYLKQLLKYFLIEEKKWKKNCSKYFWKVLYIVKNTSFYWFNTKFMKDNKNALNFKRIFYDKKENNSSLNNL